MEEIFIIDGYNCIHLRPHLNELKDESLEEARSRLIEELSDYQASRGVRLILVFDAHMQAGPGSHEVYGNMEVIFTAHGETADRRIERLARSLVAPDRRIYVATSDYVEQRVILVRAPCASRRGSCTKTCNKTGSGSAKKWPLSAVGRRPLDSACPKKWRSSWNSGAAGTSRGRPVEFP